MALGPRLQLILMNHIFDGLKPTYSVLETDVSTLIWWEDGGGGVYADLDFRVHSQTREDHNQTRKDSNIVVFD